MQILFKSKGRFPFTGMKCRLYSRTEILSFPAPYNPVWGFYTLECPQNRVCIHACNLSHDRPVCFKVLYQKVASIRVGSLLFKGYRHEKKNLFSIACMQLTVLKKQTVKFFPIHNEVWFSSQKLVYRLCHCLVDELSWF